MRNMLHSRPSKTPTYASKADEFEALWGAYVAKLARIDELKLQGRYGYQLRMPRVALRVAGNRLRDFCVANGLTFPGEAS